MPNNFESRTLRFDEILGGPHALEVPPYQRSYSWEAEEVRDLWSDLTENWSSEGSDLRELDEPYFLGSIVTIPGAIGRRALLLDGQQRLATVTIMLGAIREMLHGLGTKTAEQSANMLHRGLILQKLVDQDANYQLQLNTEDAEFFAKTVQRDPVDRSASPKLKSHRRILRARSIAFEKLEALLRERGSAEQETLLDRLWRAIADTVSVVNVTVTDETEAGRIFETLNARGLELSLADLLRNHLITETLQTEKARTAEAWDELIQDFKGVDLSPFLRYSWMSRQGDVTKKRAYKTIRSSVTATSKLKPRLYIEDLQKDAAAYLDLTNVKIIQRSNQRESDLIYGLNVLRARQAFPLLIVFHERWRRKLASQIESVNAVTFRYAVTGRNPNELETVYSDLARELRSEEVTETQAVERVREELSRKLPGDDVFRLEFRRFTPGRGDLQQYILWELERVIGHHEEMWAILDRNRVHVEHVYPQNPAEPDADLDPLVDRLGNLTLLAGTPNKSISNKPFADKKEVYGQSEVVITKELASLVQWAPANVEERQAQFAEVAVDVWKPTQR